MTAATHKFTIEQGATFLTEIQYKDSNGVAVNLTGYIIRMQARKHKRSNTALIDVSTATSGVTITDAASGTFEVKLTPAETAALNGGVLYYDLELVDTSGDVTRLIQGNINVSEEVTR